MRDGFLKMFPFTLIAGHANDGAYSRSSKQADLASASQRIAPEKVDGNGKHSHQ
jgi:hypothetical protein